MALWTHVDIHLIPGKHQYLREATAVPEGIKVIGDFWFNFEVFGKEPPAFSDVADQRFCGGEVDIWLEVPASTDTPPFVFLQFLNLLEKLRIIFFYPTVKKSFIVVKDERIMFVEEIYGVSEGRKCFRASFLPLPLPDWVKMGVADEMDTGLFLSCLFSLAYFCFQSSILTRIFLTFQASSLEGRFLYQVK